MSIRLTWRGPAAAAAMRAGAARGLTAAGEHLVEQSRREVPVDKGDLSRSIRSTVDVNELTVAVSADTPYAAVQHEDESLNHPSGGKAKYIIDPMTREQQVCLGLVAAACRRELAR